MVTNKTGRYPYVLALFFERADGITDRITKGRIDLEVEMMFYLSKIGVSKTISFLRSNIEAGIQSRTLAALSNHLENPLKTNLTKMVK